jgi:hypothetical protein
MLATETDGRDGPHRMRRVRGRSEAVERQGGGAAHAEDRRAAGDAADQAAGEGAAGELRCRRCGLPLGPPPGRRGQRRRQTAREQAAAGSAVDNGAIQSRQFLREGVPVGDAEDGLAGV